MSRMPRTPDWWQARGAVAWLLWPVQCLWAFAAKLRPMLAQPQQAGIPILCIGNAVAGGAGKTPVVLSLADMLRGLGREAHILSRGHGGTSVSEIPLRVAGQSAAEVGDEPLLLARAAPTWVGRDRVASAATAQAAGAQAALMDDGWQSPHLTKDMNLLVVDGAYGIGNGFCLPAGPLREPWPQALAKADAVVLLGEDAQGLTRDLSIPIFRAALQPEAGARSHWQGRSVLAFAGIGRPEKFFATLETLGAEIVAHRSFPDHHPYTSQEIAALREEAMERNATLVTTEKDWVRLEKPMRDTIECLPIRCVWEEESALRNWLMARL